MARKYGDDDVYLALEEIQMGSSISKSARKYGIPRSTLSEKLSGRRPPERRMGPATILSREEEMSLVTWILGLSDAGFPITKDQLLDTVQMILKKEKRDSAFVDNRPGRKWYESFRKRHPSIVEKQCQNLTRARADVSEEKLRAWFDDVHEHLTKMGHADILTDPTRIFNMDESGFFLNPKPGKVCVIGD